MLSEKLTALKQRIEIYSDTGMELQPYAVVTICQILVSLVWEARQLELSAIADSDLR